jgi:hypothetical protein
VVSIDGLVMLTTGVLEGLTSPLTRTSPVLPFEPLIRDKFQLGFLYFFLGKVSILLTLTMAHLTERN